jgi:hypothetical protein
MTRSKVGVGMATGTIKKRKPTALPHVKYQRSPTFFSWGEWNTPARRSSKVYLVDIPAFDAREMKWVYGRGEDYSQRGYVFNMSVWLTKDGRLLSRLWARSKGVRDKSLEVIGFFHKGLPLTRATEGDLYGREAGHHGACGRPTATGLTNKSGFCPRTTPGCDASSNHVFGVG